MAARGRRWFLTGLLGAAAVCAGCDLGSMAYFLMPEAKQPPQLKRLASDDKNKEVRVVILTWGGLETRPELAQADRELSERLVKQLRDLCETNQERVTIVSPRKVEEFKSTHPTWRELDLQDIGRRFHADYLIYLEINSLRLYKPGSFNTMFRGEANLTVSVVDVHRQDEPQERREFSCVYPSEARGEIPVGDVNLMEFRQAFLTYVAKRLSWFFSPYPKRESYFVE
jgi:hypothetical protein